LSKNEEFTVRIAKTLVEPNFSGKENRFLYPRIGFYRT